MMSDDDDDDDDVYAAAGDNDNGGGDCDNCDVDDDRKNDDAQRDDGSDDDDCDADGCDDDDDDDDENDADDDDEDCGDDYFLRYTYINRRIFPTTMRKKCAGRLRCIICSIRSCTLLQAELLVNRIPFAANGRPIFSLSSLVVLYYY